MAPARRLTPLALVILLAASCGDNDKSSNAPPTTTAATTTVSTGPTGTMPRPTTPSTKGNRLALGKRDLYLVLAGSLVRYASKPVRAKNVQVVQIAGIDSFWAGRSKSQRILVKINLKGHDPPKLSEGQRVSFVGKLKKASPKSASGLGVKGKTGEPMLQAQGVYVLVNYGDLKLH